MRRHQARAQALEMLYEADARDEAPAAVEERRRAIEDAEVDPYAHDLLAGVAAHAQEIDDLIVAHARDWDLPHMPMVDRNILRLGLYELRWGGVPPAVVMDEAVELCREFSTEEAGRFVNGVLSAVAAIGP